jgi:membrane protease YdiL (CAAX protease family)
MLVILLLYPVIVLAASLLASLSLFDAVEFPLSSGLLSESAPQILLTILFILVVGPVSAEPGWWGYALDRLQERWSPLVASLVLVIGLN